MVHHIAIEIIFEIFQTVDIYPGSPAEMKKLFLVIHMVAVKDLNSLSCTYTSFPNRNLSLRQFQHISFHLCQKFRCDLHISVNGIVISGTHRKMQGHFPYPVMSSYMIYCFQ